MTDFSLIVRKEFLPEKSPLFFATVELCEQLLSSMVIMRNEKIIIKKSVDQ